MKNAEIGSEKLRKIRNSLRYGIATKSRMESSRREYTLTRDAIRLWRFHVLSNYPLYFFKNAVVDSLINVCYTIIKQGTYAEFSEGSNNNGNEYWK